VGKLGLRREFAGNTPETSEHMKLVKGDADVSRTSRFKNTRLEEELFESRRPGDISVALDKLHMLASLRCVPRKIQGRHTAPLFSLSACETLDTDRLNSQQTLDGDPTYPQYGLGLRREFAGYSGGRYPESHKRRVRIEVPL
jgi:hypothetical protein